MVEFRPLQGEFGADVLGVRPDLIVSEDDFRSIEAAWFRYSILLFRGLSMTPAQHVTFTRRLGPLHVMKEHMGRPSQAIRRCSSSPTRCATASRSG